MKGKLPGSTLLFIFLVGHYCLTIINTYKMRTSISLIIFLSVTLSSTAQINYLNESESDMAQRMQWFTDAKYGMFIHFGLYSQLGGIYDGND